MKHNKAVVCDVVVVDGEGVSIFDGFSFKGEVEMWQVRVEDACTFIEASHAGCSWQRESMAAGDGSCA